MRTLPKTAFILVFLLAHIFILRNVFLLSKDFLYGDLSGEKIIPSARYPFARLPDNPETQQYHAQNRLAIDFAQIYFPAQQMSSLTENYQSGALDPLGRPARYPPLLHFLCSLAICRLDYGSASLLYMLIQVLLFYLVLILSFKLLHIEKVLLPGILLVDVYLFLTPAGLSWFERGQFSLYVAGGYLLLLLGLVKRNIPLVLLSALFAFVKWTSFPYIFVVFSVGILGSKTLSEAKRNFLLAVAFLLIVILLLLPYPEQGMVFLQGLLAQERFALPGGISLTKLLPVYLAKLLPLPLITLGWLHLKLNRVDLESAVPFWTGSAVLMLTYPTLAYDYNLPSLLGFIPLTIYWAKQSGAIPAPVRGFMKYAFFVFLLLASSSNYIHLEVVIMGEYFLVSLILLVLPLFYYWKSARGPNPP